MADMSFDAESALVFPFSLGAAINLGIVESDVLGFDLGSSFYQAGSIDITLAAVIAIVSLLVVFVNRDVAISDTGGTDAWILYATVALTLAPVFPSLVEGLGLANTIVSFVAFVIQGTGFLAISYIN